MLGARLIHGAVWENRAAGSHFRFWPFSAMLGEPTNVGS